MYCTNPACPDLQATGTPSAYVDGIVTCPVCGAELVESVADGPAGSRARGRGLDADVEVEAVFDTADPTELEIVKTILEGAGIPFLVEGLETFNAFRGGRASLRYNPSAGAVSVVVPAALAEEARILLTRADNGGDKVDLDWQE